MIMDREMDLAVTDREITVLWSAYIQLLVCSHSKLFSSWSYEIYFLREWRFKRNAIKGKKENRVSESDQEEIQIISWKQR